MRSTIDTPENWRACANEARVIGEGMSNPEAKGMMLDIVAAYERMARTAAERAKKPS